MPKFKVQTKPKDQMTKFIKEKLFDQQVPRKLRLVGGVKGHN
jgi:hypothetical protein